MRHGEGLARTGDAQQHLVALVALEPFDQLGNGLRLVTGGLELRLQYKGSAAIAGGPFQDCDCGIGQSRAHALNIGQALPFANAQAECRGYRIYWNYSKEP